MIAFWTGLLDRFPIVSIEDPLGGGRLGRLGARWSRASAAATQLVGRRPVRHERGAAGARHPGALRQRDPGQGEPDRHAHGDARRDRVGAAEPLRRGRLASQRRDRGHDDRRPRGRDQRRPDQGGRARRAASGPRSSTSSSGSRSSSATTLATRARSCSARAADSPCARRPLPLPSRPAPSATSETQPRTGAAARASRRARRSCCTLIDRRARALRRAARRCTSSSMRSSPARATGRRPRAEERRARRPRRAAPRSDAFLERLARQCLGMVKPGEIAFVVVPKEGAPAPPPSASARYAASRGSNLTSPASATIRYPMRRYERVRGRVVEVGVEEAEASAARQQPATLLRHERRGVASSAQLGRRVHGSDAHAVRCRSAVARHRHRPAAVLPEPHARVVGGRRVATPRTDLSLRLVVLREHLFREGDDPGDHEVAILRSHGTRATGSCRDGQHVPQRIDARGGTRAWLQIVGRCPGADERFQLGERRDHPGKCLPLLEAAGRRARRAPRRRQGCARTRLSGWRAERAAGHVVARRRRPTGRTPRTESGRWIRVVEIPRSRL